MTNRAASRPDRRRRQWILASGGAALLAAFGGAGRALANPADTAAAIEKITGGKTPVDGGIELRIPEIAENGNTVPVTITVDSPMSASDYVAAIYLFAEKNPIPDVAVFHLTPASGKAVVSTRIRLAETQRVIAIAQAGDGTLRRVMKHVKVTIGGCGG